ncbi:MAG: type II secretion system protein [Oscillospiraceae bacterium]|nr:type II secretion system protein [Oscillospiraceae bacterium]
MKRKHGFTLLEVMVVVAIIGVLLAILVPALYRMIVKAQKKAVIANAKTLYTDCMNILEDNIVYYEEEYNSLFTKDGSKWCFRATADGYCESYKSKTIASSYAAANNKWKQDEKNPNYKGCYWLNVLFRVDGRCHAVMGDNETGVWGENPSMIANTWSDADYHPGKTQVHSYFIERLSTSQDLIPYTEGGYTFPLRLPYGERGDGEKPEICRWLICQNTRHKDKLEIWVGDGTKGKNGPVYRVYPDPNEFYLTTD